MSSTGASDVAAVVAKYFKAAGMRHVYGVPGEDHMRLLDAFESEGLEYVLTRQEGPACMMAATEAQVAGDLPGLCVVSIAAGLSNAINGIAHAYLDRIPLIVISGQHARNRHPITVRQSLDNHELVRGITKWSATVGTEVEQVLHKAMDIALTHPRGPVFLELSEETAVQPAKEVDARWQRWRGAQPTGAVGAPVEEVKSLLAKADRPVMVLGGGGFSVAERDALLRMADAYNCLLMTTAAAKGSVPAGHPRLAGTFLGGNLETAVLSRCDALLMVNASATEFYNKPWKYGRPLVALSRYHNTEGFLPVDVELAGDLAEIATALAASEGRGASSEWSDDDVDAYRQSVIKIFSSPSSPLSIAEVVWRTQAVLPGDALLAVDAGFSKPIINLLWHATAPDTYFASHGLSTMGFAVPAANALQLLHPQRQTLAFMGDGSLMMRAPEIGVAAAHGLAPIYVVFVDGTMTQIAVKQERRQLAQVGAHFPVVSCAQLAAAFGGQGFDVETPDDYEDTLREGLRSSVPTLIGVRLDQSDRGRLFEALRG